MPNFEFWNQSCYSGLCNLYLLTWIVLWNSFTFVWEFKKKTVSTLYGNDGWHDTSLKTSTSIILKIWFASYFFVFWQPRLPIFFYTKWTSERREHTMCSVCSLLNHTSQNQKYANNILTSYNYNYTLLLLKNTSVLYTQYKKEYKKEQFQIIIINYTKITHNPPLILRTNFHCLSVNPNNFLPFESKFHNYDDAKKLPLSHG